MHDLINHSINSAIDLLTLKITWFYMIDCSSITWNEYNEISCNYKNITCHYMPLHVLHGITRQTWCKCLSVCSFDQLAQYLRSDATAMATNNFLEGLSLGCSLWHVTSTRICSRLSHPILFLNYVYPESLMILIDWVTPSNLVLSACASQFSNHRQPRQS